MRARCPRLASDDRGLLHEAMRQMQRNCTEARGREVSTRLRPAPAAVLLLLVWSGCAAPQGDLLRGRSDLRDPGGAGSAVGGGPTQSTSDAATQAGTAGTSALEAAPHADAAQSPAPAATPAPDAAPDPSSTSVPIHGSLSSMLRGRWSGGEHDYDVLEVLALDVGDAARGGWTGHLMTRVAADLDGHPSGSPSVFSDLHDTYDEAVVPVLYDAYAEKRDVGTFERVRIGRQSLWDTPEFAWFDGVSAETKESGPQHMLFGGYVGIPTAAYESAHQGDWIGGLYGLAQPWTGGRARVEWMHVDDQSTPGTEEVDLWKLAVGQHVGKNLDFDGSYTRMLSDDRDVRLHASWYEPEAAFTVQATYYQLLQTQGSLPLPLDPYSESLNSLFPFHQGQLLFTKGFSAHVDVTGGVDARRVSDSGDEGTFNRDFDRVYSTVVLRDLLPGSVAAGLTGEVWDGTGSHTESWGLDLSRPFGTAVDGSIGSYYSLYKVDVFADEERTDVRTYYLRCKWRRTADTTWDLWYEHENDDVGTYDLLRVGLTWRF
jgi:hypothetical protein